MIKIININGTSTKYFDQATDYFKKNKGKSVTALVERSKNLIPIPLIIDNSGKVGIETKLFSVMTLDSMGLLQFGAFGIFFFRIFSSRI